MAKPKLDWGREAYSASFVGMAMGTMVVIKWRLNNKPAMVLDTNRVRVLLGNGN